MKDLSIGIVGGGTVGRATARCYLEYVKSVKVWDSLAERRTTHNILDMLDSDLIFVCLPEMVVDSFFAMLYGPNKSRNYVIKSTVPIGTTRRLSTLYSLPNLVHSPEFLTERCAMTDVQMPAVNIVGRVQRGEKWVERSQCSVRLSELYLKRFPGIDCLDVTSDESEAIKLFLNGFFAVKVAYFNEIHSLASTLGLDWELVRMGMLADGRVGHPHTQVPGPDGGKGFGGKCLPKDLKTLVEQLIQTFGHESYAAVTRAASLRNSNLDRLRGHP